LENAGNTIRDLTLDARAAGDDATLCEYTLNPAEVRLLPERTTTVLLEAQPTNKWWRRPFQGRTLNFLIELEDKQNFPLATKRLQGVLLWEARPWWHLLLIILGILLALAGLIFAIWWFFFRPKAPPQIVEFALDRSDYSEADGDIIRLNWRISKPEEVQTLTVKGLSSDGKVLSDPVEYNFSQGIPPSLRNFCASEQVLICQNVPTDARRAGKYTFDMSLVPKSRRDGETISAQTSTAEIFALPQPKIAEFASTAPEYTEASPVLPIGDTETADTGAGDRVLLNWKIANPEQIRELRVVGRNPQGIVTSRERRYNFLQGIPRELEGFCNLDKEGLSCQEVPTDAREAGEHIFELIVFSKL